MKVINKFWIGLGILIIFSPLGLLLPAYFKAGSAWGEWSSAEIKGLVGYIPKGLEKLSSFWNALIPDYVFKGWVGNGIFSLSLAYIISAILGIGLTLLLAIFIGKLLTKKD